MKINEIAKLKNTKKISMLTCYDYAFAKILDKSSVDMLLVGDSAAMTVHGYPSTTYATTEMMIMHTAAVRRGAPSKFIVADMPFLTFRKTLADAATCAGALINAGANAVKLEGMDGNEEVIKHLIGTGIPVMGHIGLVPQSVNKFGGYKVQGVCKKSAADLKNQAKQLEKSGCFAIVLECIPAALAAQITKAIKIPAIGIGAGAGTDGQVLVLQDILGFDDDVNYKFVRRYADLQKPLLEAFNKYDEDVKKSKFPSKEESF